MAKEGRTMFYKQLRGSRTDRGSQLESGREVAGSQQTQKLRQHHKGTVHLALPLRSPARITQARDNLLPRKRQAEDIAIPKWPL